MQEIKITLGLEEIFKALATPLRVPQSFYELKFFLFLSTQNSTNPREKHEVQEKHEACTAPQMIPRPEMIPNRK